MDNKKIILIAIVVLVIILAVFGAFLATKENPVDNLANLTENKTVINIDLANNTTVVGDNSTRVNETANNNTTYKVYNPQSDSYVDVIGEKFDEDVNRWYTYDTDGVRYYNTRIN
ncbi:hypothetical protein [Methanobrevibacter sp.]|uniref:hypothetical protein n=1 Tax=Methanobrevibacter sp. TaxID=66852 RepID=UPI00388D041E